MATAPVTEDPSFTVRPTGSIQEARELWWPLMKELGWNRDPSDTATHFHSARQGSDWLVLVPKETSKPEGCVVAFTYPNGTGWVGFFIVNAAYRGKGWGRALFHALLARYIESNTTIVGLDGVFEQIKTYERRGFVDVAKIRLMVRPSLNEKPLPTTEYALEEGERTEDIREVNTGVLADIDFAHTGMERRLLWSREAMFERKDAYGYVIGSVAGDGFNSSGFIIVRRCEHGHRFGPLYAESYAHASMLLRKAMERVRDSEGSMIAEIFGSNVNGVKVFEELGWALSGMDYNRMWLGGRVPQEQQDGGKGTTGMFAIFDASEG
ncbi:hypothetical protein K469DRAFT_712563 [Zopfia rhizophila CBS 207.26]|uniref:N-acetyltransferase domain-containing protein n=1 Tax=Zopfia rhizophila CBS 207.26 TaxID=1314779 RepID=A0A6A6ERV3_9PEZI|nr:hypothetical protein K469DRAFT_712563 [Zopfia rhizophila CBS 207.26]